MPPFDSLGVVSYSTSIANYLNYGGSRTVSEIHQLIGQKSPNFLTPFIRRPIRGEAVGVKQQLSVTKN